jgi:lipoic acid synthetase
MARELPIFTPPGSGHAHGPVELPTIAMGGGLAAEPATDGSRAPRRHPEWIRARMPSGDTYHDLKRLMRGQTLNTVCEEALCPNIGECWDQRTATIMILGDTCTRACGFCAVKTGRPTWFDDDEPRRVAEAVGQMGLDHVVVTSVARDDLPDEGAGAFAETIRQMRERTPGMGIEVLIPDFNGSADLLRIVMDARPDILNHNLETVRRLQKPVRRRARWDRSLGVLDVAKRQALEIGYPVHTKSSLMVGLGETRDELTEAFEALRAVDTDILTVGQYLRPSEKHLPVERYYHPDEFAEMKTEALALGFRHVESAPLVRSSYHARDQVPGAELKAARRRQATIDAEGRVIPLAG